MPGEARQNPQEEQELRLRILREFKRRPKTSGTLFRISEFWFGDVEESRIAAALRRLTACGLLRYKPAEEAFCVVDMRRVDETLVAGQAKQFRQSPR